MSAGLSEHAAQLEARPYGSDAEMRTRRYVIDVLRYHQGHVDGHAAAIFELESHAKDITDLAQFMHYGDEVPL